MKKNSNGSANGAVRLEAGRVLNAITALQAISGRFNDEVPFIDSYTVARMMTRLNNHPDVEATDAKRRELIMKFGEREEATGNVRITPLSPKFREYIDAYQPIADTLLELDGVRLLHPKVLKHVKGVQPAELQALWPLLEEISDEGLAELVEAITPAPSIPGPVPVKEPTAKVA